MAYVRKNWINTETPLSADNMNNIEDGIEENKGSIETLNLNVINGVSTRNQQITPNGQGFFTAPYSGWLVVTGEVGGETLSIQPFIEIKNSNENAISSAWGSLAANSVVRACAPVKKGQQYQIRLIRCSLSWAGVYY